MRNMHSSDVGNHGKFDRPAEKISEGCRQKDVENILTEDANWWRHASIMIATDSPIKIEAWRHKSAQSNQLTPKCGAVKRQLSSASDPLDGRLERLRWLPPGRSAATPWGSHQHHTAASPWQVSLRAPELLAFAPQPGRRSDTRRGRGWGDCSVRRRVATHPHCKGIGRDLQVGLQRIVCQQLQGQLILEFGIKTER